MIFFVSFFFLYFRVVLSQWILSSGWTDHDHDGKNVGIWIDESKGLSTFRDSHGSKRIHIWAHGSVVLSIHIAPRIHISSHISIYLVVVSIFVFLSLGEITQSDEHMFAKGLKPPTCDSQISNRNSIRVLHKNSKVIFYTRESTIWTKSQTINSYDVCIIMSYCYICCHCFGYFRINK